MFCIVCTRRIPRYSAIKRDDDTVVIIPNSTAGIPHYLCRPCYAKWRDVEDEPWLAFLRRQEVNHRVQNHRLRKKGYPPERHPFDVGIRYVEYICAACLSPAPRWNHWVCPCGCNKRVIDG